MAIDIDALLAPVSDDDLAGPDLAYDPARYQLEQAFETSVSVDANGEETAAAEIDWRDIVRQIEAQSRLTKDIWLAVYLCRAGARQQSLETVEAGTQYLAGLLERYWPTVHPTLDEYGFQGRKGPCDSLTQNTQFLRPLQNIILLSHPRLGRFSAADFDRFRIEAEAADGYGMFRAALQETPEEALLEIAARIERIEQGIRRSDAVLTANAEGDTAPNYQPTYAALSAMRKGVLAFSASPPAPEQVEGEAEQATPGASATAGPRIAGRIDSREDVIKALEAIADYYRRAEPTSPIPLVLRRARDWVKLDFLSVLEDIAPGGLDEAKRMLVSQRSGTPDGENSNW